MVRPITIPLQGGLGNQLFQLAAGIAVTSRSGRPVLYSDHWLRHPAPLETPRHLEIGQLLAPGELTTEPAPRVGHVSDRLLGRRVVERRSDDDALARVDSRTRYLAGYFQRLSYVQESWPTLHERFRASGDASQRALVDAGVRDVGALHYRLGDYLTSATARAAHGVTAPEYFAAVVRDGQREHGIQEWVVVSDDPGTALQLLSTADLPAEVRLVASDGADEWADLLALARARVVAISNSSFSWWAAFIGASTHEQLVVAPRPWFTEASAPEPALFPAGWQRRERTVLTD